MNRSQQLSKQIAVVSRWIQTSVGRAWAPWGWLERGARGGFAVRRRGTEPASYPDPALATNAFLAVTRGVFGDEVERVAEELALERRAREAGEDESGRHRLRAREILDVRFGGEPEGPELVLGCTGRRR
jgi:hypothetical protein